MLRFGEVSLHDECTAKVFKAAFSGLSLTFNAPLCYVYKPMLFAALAAHCLNFVKVLNAGLILGEAENCAPALGPIRMRLHVHTDSSRLCPSYWLFCLCRIVSLETILLVLKVHKMQLLQALSLLTAEGKPIKRQLFGFYERKSLLGVYPEP